jgi:hypothetical protein
VAERTLREGGPLSVSDLVASLQAQPPRKTKHYCIIRRESKDEPLFLFLKTQKEKDAVVRDFPDLIVNEFPFKTVCP